MKLRKQIWFWSFYHNIAFRCDRQILQFHENVDIMYADMAFVEYGTEYSI